MSTNKKKKSNNMKKSDPVLSNQEDLKISSKLDSKKIIENNSLCQTQLSQEQFIKVVLEQIEGIRKDKIYEELLEVCSKHFPTLDFDMFIVCQAVNTINIRGWESITLESLAKQFEILIAKNIHHQFVVLQGTVHIEAYGIVNRYLKDNLDTKINESILGKKFIELEKGLKKKNFNGYIEDKVNEMLADTINIELNTRSVKELVSNISSLTRKTNVMQEAYNKKFKDINIHLDKLPKDTKKRNESLQKEILRITQTNITNKLDELKFIIDEQYRELEKTFKNQSAIKSKPTDFTLITEDIKKLQEEIVKINNLIMQHSKSLQSINCKLQQQNNNTYKQNLEFKQAIKNNNILIKKLQKTNDKHDKNISKYQEIIDKQEDKITVLESKFSELQKTISQENEARISFQAESTNTIDQLKYFNSQHQMILSLPQYQIPFQYNTQYQQYQQYQQAQESQESQESQPPLDTIITAKLAE